MHDRLRTVIVAPLTTGSRAAPFRIGVTCYAWRPERLDSTGSDARRGQDSVAKKLGALPPKTLTSTLITQQEVYAE